MIERKELGLREVGPEEYIQLKRELKRRAEEISSEGESLEMRNYEQWIDSVSRIKIESGEIIKKHRRESLKRKKGYVEIETPLVYGSFEEIIEEVIGTEEVFKITIPNRRGWGKYMHQQFEQSGILEEMGQRAKEAGGVYVHFDFKWNYNLGLKKYGERIVSTDVSFPGKCREDFKFEGSETEYALIHGIWVPRKEQV